MLELFYKRRVVFVVLLGIVLRFTLLGIIPGNGNLNQDEAFAAYEAFAISNYGMDSHGYHNPVYLEAWGSGMNALETYCMIPFIKVLGMNATAVRLPQAILGSLTLIVLYLLLKKLSDKNVAFWCTLVLAICPWHIMMSRWALESNFIVGVLTLAVYFLVSADNKVYRIIIAGITMGLVLYCYSATWTVIPLLVIGILTYLFINKEITIKSIIIYLISLGIVAIPLLLFVAVNMGFISEIRTDFISIPKMAFFRSGDVYFSIERLLNSLRLLWYQDDGLIWNSTSNYGLFYHFSNGFLAVGIISSIIKKRKNMIVIGIWLACGLLLSSMLDANVNRINIIFIPVVCFIGIGIEAYIRLIGIISTRTRVVAASIVLVAYIYNLISFENYYCGEYNTTMAAYWFDGAKEALAMAEDNNATIHIKYNDVRYPSMLYYTEYPTDVFVSSVKYENTTAAFLQPLSCEGYEFYDYTEEKPHQGEMYICRADDVDGVDYIKDYNLESEKYGQYILSYVKNK